MSNVNMENRGERVGIVLACEGMGDCLYAMSVIKKMYQKTVYRFDLFTHHPALFKACPYVENVYAMADEATLKYYPHRVTSLFDLKKLPHWGTDTFDFIALPAGIQQLSFREKQLEYFPTEEDAAESFDVVLNTSQTWFTRSWSMEHWQRLAKALTDKGLSVAVVGKDISSRVDQMEKRSLPLEGCRNLVNQLSLDQTFYTIGKAGLFVTCQNGLSVLAGATDTEIVVLDMSIEWSKRAIYRLENPHHKVGYVKGNCDIHCGEGDVCPRPDEAEKFCCVPTYEKVEAMVFQRLQSV